MARGQMTEQIQDIAKGFLGREITTGELRLYPYLDHVMKNNQIIEPVRCNGDDRKVLAVLRSEGHIEGGASGLAVTKEFYDYINHVLWHSYVIDAELD